MQNQPTRITTDTQISEVDWNNWQYTEHAVLCFIRKEGKILLIHKKTGLGTGKINAPGGRIEKGETPLEAAIRETQEEVCVTPHNLIHRADLHFIFTNGYSLRGYAFFADDFTGEIAETFEADPFWVSENEIPWDKMWEDDTCWLPLALQGKNVKGRFIFDEDTMCANVVEEK